jgi:uncharacterized membrane protein
MALLNREGALRVVFGLLFILFIPGYVLVFALFPMKKTDHGIDIIERIALSFCVSIAIVPLIGLALNYTSWGIQLDTILISIFIFITGVGAFAICRWIKTPLEERFTITFNISLPKSKEKYDKLLNIILVLFIIIAVAFLVYAIVMPKTGEKFTDFYLLDSKGIAMNYPTTLTVGENTSVILGIVNHEYQTINYTIEVWLTDQTIVFNETTQENKSAYNHMWFINKITVTLNHTPPDIEKRWEPQWEYNYTFNTTREGTFKLAFLLFTTPTENYTNNEDYKELAEEIINSAYRETHLWVTVTYFKY